MIVVIPVDDDKETLCVSFGRAPYFMFVDSDNEEIAIKENPAADTPGGAGIKAAQFIVDNNADVLITVRCGENAAEVFRAANISIYKAAHGTARENYRFYKGEKLEALTQFHAGFHGI